MKSQRREESYPKQYIQLNTPIQVADYKTQIKQKLNNK